MTLYFVCILIFVCFVTTEVLSNNQKTSLVPIFDREDVQNTSFEDNSETSSNDQGGTMKATEISTTLRFAEFTSTNSNKQVQQLGYTSTKQALSPTTTTAKMVAVSTLMKKDNSTEHKDADNNDHTMKSSTLSSRFGKRDLPEAEKNGLDDFTPLQAKSIDNKFKGHVMPFANLTTPSNTNLRENTLKTAIYQSTETIIFQETQNPTTHLQDRFPEKMTQRPITTEKDATMPQHMVSVLHEVDRFTTKVEEKQRFILTTQTSITQSRPGFDVCDQYGGCPSQEKDSIWFCHCDDSCLEYKDCCQDYIQSDTFQLKQDIYTCLRVDQENTNIFGIYVIASCPEQFSNITIIDKCISYNNLQNGPPVINKHKSAQVFANIYCALCNGVTEVTLMSIQVYDLPFNVSLQEIESFQSKSDLLYLDNNVKSRLIGYEAINLRKCIHSIQDSHKIECQRYINPMIDDSNRRVSVYRNTHCIEDSLLVKMTTQETIYCLAELRFKDIFDENWNHNKLSVIFNFGQNEENEENHGMCSVWSKEVDQLCTNLPIYVNVQESMEFVLQIPSNISEMTDDLMIQVGLAAMSTYYVPEIVKLTRYSTIAKDDSGFFIKGEFTVIIQKQCFRWELENILNDLKQRKINFVVTTKEEKNNVLLSSTSESPVINFTSLKKINFRFDSSIYQKLSYYLIRSLPAIGINKVCRDITIHSQLIGNELVIGDVICDSPTTTTGISPLEVLTYAEFTLSTIALVPLIIVNRRINQRMTLPRTNIENISLSLICTNCLFMVGIGMVHMANICYGIGITLHYLFLTTFVFMTIGVMSVSLAVIKLEQQRNRTKEKMKRKRLLITIVGLALPLIIVCPAVLMDRFGPPEWSPGYGYTACFPTRFPGNVAFFSGPVVLLLVIDLICLICIIIHVERTRGNTRRVLNICRTTDDVKLYLRLVILSGALWLVGIFAVLLESEWLDYLFTISCGLQGFFMSVAGLSTKEAREKIKCHRKGEQTEMKDL